MRYFIVWRATVLHIVFSCKAFTSKAYSHCNEKQTQYIQTIREENMSFIKALKAVQFSTVH